MLVQRRVIFHVRVSHLGKDPGCEHVGQQRHAMVLDAVAILADDCDVTAQLLFGVPHRNLRHHVKFAILALEVLAQNTQERVLW